MSIMIEVSLNYVMMVLNIIIIWLLTAVSEIMWMLDCRQGTHYSSAVPRAKCLKLKVRILMHMITFRRMRSQICALGRTSSRVSNPLYKLVLVFGT